MPIKLLIVEDDHSLQEAWKRAIEDYFGSEIILFQATTIPDAQKLWDENPDIDVIAMDACVPGCEPNTIPLVEHIKGMFKGTMITISGSADYRKLLMEAGCDVECEKSKLPQTLKRLLGKK